MGARLLEILGEEGPGGTDGSPPALLARQKRRAVPELPLTKTCEGQQPGRGAQGGRSSQGADPARRAPVEGRPGQGKDQQDSYRPRQGGRGRQGECQQMAIPAAGHQRCNGQQQEERLAVRGGEEQRRGEHAHRHARAAGGLFPVTLLGPGSQQAQESQQGQVRYQ